jgi:hypothetical protein
MTTSEIQKALNRPFEEKLISWRVGATTPDKAKGIGLAYIDARDVMDRLDSVFGLDWQCKYSHADKKTICELSVLIDGQWVTRANGAGDSDVEAEKGAISDAFKRAAVMFGIGRYLYSLPNEWVEIKQQGKSYALVTPPKLPDWATPKGFDCGLTPFGYSFGGIRLNFLQDLAKEVMKVYARTEQGEHDAYKKWTSFIDAKEFQSNEEQMFAWFELESHTRSAIKRIKLQTENLLKETA